MLARLLIARPPGYLLAARNVDADRFTELVGAADFRPPQEALAALDVPALRPPRDPYGEGGGLLPVHRFESALRELPRVDGTEGAPLLIGPAQERCDGTAEPPTSDPQADHQQSASLSTDPPEDGFRRRRTRMGRAAGSDNGGWV